MAVGIKLRSITDEIGTADFFHAFFSTISGNLEPEVWGSRFPILLTRLYSGELNQIDASAALEELDEVCAELARLPVDRVIWDIADRSKTPPWGDNISEDVTNLSNYFMTSTGRDLLVLLREILEELRDTGGTMKIVTF